MVFRWTLVAVLAAMAAPTTAQDRLDGRCEEISRLAEQVQAGVDAALRIIPPDIEKLGADGNLGLAMADIRHAVTASPPLTGAGADRMIELMSAIAAAVPHLWRLQDATREFEVDC